MLLHQQRAHAICKRSQGVRGQWNCGLEGGEVHSDVHSFTVEEREEHRQAHQVDYGPGQLVYDCLGSAVDSPGRAQSPGMPSL